MDACHKFVVFVHLIEKGPVCAFQQLFFFFAFLSCTSCCGKRRLQWPIMNNFTSQAERIESLEKFISDLKVARLTAERDEALFRALIGDYINFYLQMIKSSYEETEATEEQFVCYNFVNKLRFEKIQLRRSKRLQVGDALDTASLKLSVDKVSKLNVYND